MSSKVFVSYLAVFFIASAVSRADVDNIVTLVDRNTGTGGKTLGGFAYDPATKSIYVASFGFSGDENPGNAVIRRVTGVFNGSGVLNPPGSSAFTNILSEAQMRLFYQDGDSSRTSNLINPSGFLLNPQPITIGPTTYPAYSFALLTDLATVGPPNGASGTDPVVTKRVYAYNLGSPPPGGDGRDVMTARVTLAQMYTALGRAPGTSSNVGRQFAWSGDGAAIYFNDSGNPTTAVGGVWKMDAISGALTRIYAEDNIAEPAVKTSGTIDTIMLQGGGTTGNTGGIDMITHNRADNTTTNRAVAISALTLNRFLDLPDNATSFTATSMTYDANGTLYMATSGPSNPERRGVYTMDAQGRLAKLITRAERADEFGVASPNALSLRMQAHNVTYSGPNGTFEVPMLMYGELAPISLVAGAYAFKPGDFNRDNAVTSADLNLFAPKLTTRGGAAIASQADAKFDMNGNAVIDWKDVKILQTFMPTLLNGDANMDLAVNYTDLNLMRDNYYTLPSQTTERWTTGDFASLDPLATIYSATAADANLVNLVDLEVIAETWLNVLGQTKPTFADLDANGYIGQFRTDVIAAFEIVPEPASALLLLLGAAMMTRFRRVVR